MRIRPTPSPSAGAGGGAVVVVVPSTGLRAARDSAIWCLQLALEARLLARLVDAGAPQLVRHEQEQQRPDGDEDAPGGVGGAAHRATVAARRGQFGPRWRPPGRRDSSRVRPFSGRVPTLSRRDRSPDPHRNAGGPHVGSAPRRLVLSQVVRLRSVVALLGRFPALAGVDLDVGAGEIVLITGPNGAGKTTLLRLLAGLVPPYSGEATVRGHDLATDRRAARGRYRSRRPRDVLLRRPDRGGERALLRPCVRS